MGARNLKWVIALVAGGLFSFFAFLAWGALSWTPALAVAPTRRTLKSPALAVGTPALARGHRLYRETGCALCHGPNGEGGVKNPNSDSDPPEAIPGLYDLAEAYTRKDLLRKVHNGYQPRKLRADEPDPRLSMPAFGGVLEGDEVEAVADYLFSLKEEPR